MLVFWDQTARRSSAKARIVRRPKRFKFRGSSEIHRLGLIYLVLVAVQVASFIYYHGMSWWFIFSAVPCGILLGFGLSGFNQLVKRLREVLLNRMGKVLSGFLLFFIHLIGYILIFSVLVSWPIGRLLEYFSGRIGIAGDFELYSINFILLCSILIWLQGLPRRAYSRNS